MRPKRICLRCSSGSRGGEQFTITKHGRPIARLVPVARTNPDRRREVIERLKRFREGQTLDVPLKQLISEGRR